MRKNNKYLDPVNTPKEVKTELARGLRILNAIDKPIVTFFGSARTPENDKYYTHANHVASELGKRGFAVLSGGGPGIMQAANSGAMKSQTESIGFKAALLSKEKVQKHLYTHEGHFVYLFVRRFLLAIKSKAIILYPGGYGTLNELFEYLMLMQTKVLDRVPIICVGKKFWKGLDIWLKQVVLQNHMVDKVDLSMVHVVESEHEVLSMLK